jgi:hypothetical protein
LEEADEEKAALALREELTYGKTHLLTHLEAAGLNHTSGEQR